MGLATRLCALALAAVLMLSAGCVRNAPPKAQEAPAQAAGQAAAGQSAQAAGQGVEQGGFLSQAGSPLSGKALAGRAKGARYVLVGEAHPSPCDHKAQAQVMELLAQAGRPPAVGLEMVSQDMQPALTAFNSGLVSVDELPRALDWERTWGFDFEAYRPIFETARRLGLPLYALNVPREVASKAGRVGLAGLSPAERQGLPARIIPPPKAQLDFLRAVFSSHATGRKDTSSAWAWKRFVTVQSLWDTTMAQSAVLAAKDSGRPVVIVAGGGHVESGWGIASRLAVLDPDGARLVVMPWRGGQAPAPDQADAFFYCPTAHPGRLGLSLEEQGGALVVRAVEPASLAQQTGIAVGDVLRLSDGKPLATVRDLRQAAAKALSQGGKLRLEITRDGAPLSLEVDMEPARP